MKNFSEFNINTLDDKQVFRVPIVSISDLVNCKIEVMDFEANIKTRHGEGRYLVKIKFEGIERKFFTASTPKFNENPFKKDTPVVPFGGSGETYRYWDAENCSKCINCERESQTEDDAKCKLEYYISLGTIAGTIPLWVAKEIGSKYNALYGYVDIEPKCRKFNDGSDTPW